MVFQQGYPGDCPAVFEYCLQLFFFGVEVHLHEDGSRILLLFGLVLRGLPQALLVSLRALAPHFLGLSCCGLRH